MLMQLRRSGISGRREECRTYGARDHPPLPSPSGLGSRLANGPPGLDAIVGRTFLLYRNGPLKRKTSKARQRLQDAVSMDVEVVVQLPLAYAVVVALPFLGLYLDVVVGVVAA